VVEAGGIETQTVENTRLTKSGQDGTHPGQVESQAGQTEEVASVTEGEDGLDPGHAVSKSGHASAPILPPLFLDRLRHVDPALADLIEAWPKLSLEVRRAVAALVAAVDEQGAGR